jgi:phospholipid/cholesterol/gamma-HCH transport system substrate-binding protein
MAKKIINNIKLGLFVLAGLLFLVFLLYMIGRNQNLFGKTYRLKARFGNIQGLVTGNNVRFAGIHAGTVKKISIISDTVIEVTMIIDTKMKNIIRKNAIASINTDGLVGNRVVNIVPAHTPAPFAEEGDVLAARRVVATDDMVQTLYKTNMDVADIAADLKTTVQRINSSTALWSLLSDQSIPENLRAAVGNIRSATVKAGTLADNLNAIVMDVKSGKGSLGEILKDTILAKSLNEAVVKIKTVASKADELAVELNELADEIRQDVKHGNGAVNMLLKDSLVVLKLNASLDNIQKGTAGFNQNMEALKHNVLLRGYFKKQDKKKQRDKQ